jgi:phage regulator Rha-like protein
VGLKGDVLDTTNFGLVSKRHVSQCFTIRHDVITRIGSIVRLKHHFDEAETIVEATRNKQPVIYQSLQLHDVTN